MTAESPELPLAAAFPDADRAQWQRLVEGVLRKSGVAEATGAAAEDALATDLQDGIRVRPLYTAEDGTAAPGHPGFPPFVRAGRPEGTTVAGWDVRQRHVHTEPERANESVLADLENGVTSVWLTVGDGGVPVAGLERALRGVYLDLAAVVLDAGADFAAAAEELLRLYTASGAPVREAAGCLGADPLGLLARTGDDAKLRVQLESAARMAARCSAEAPGVRALAVDALAYHEAGGSAAEELGTSLATGVAYLRQLTDSGLGIDDACRQLEFRYAATADQFLTIAKLRAARRLWARVAEVCGASPAASAQRQHAVTSTVMMTRRDPWVNMLRTTVAGLSAGVGGADAVTVLPFDAALGLPDAFARRIARNTQSVLLEESHLSKVIDPAGGSWYVESLTDELARAAWAWFQEIEGAGGQAAALRSGMIAGRLAETWERRTEDLAHRREPITGVSEFPHLAEPPVNREPAPAPIGGGLPRVRRDDTFERLRSRSDAHLAASGARPKVFLAALGPVATHTARVAFAANLFQAGGIETVAEPAPVDAESVAEAFARSGARIACLCAGDAVYGEQGAAVAAALKSAGALRVHLAGKPRGQRDEFVAAGVDSFVFTGCDAVEVLSSALDVMEVA
ncbi:methylmalonyl-CoA mutase subunit beta [Streptomyces sp. Je 1-4]|uniref:methylmalonyl-CoA mutase subunit beta n=1 Tax=Streptomyces TaxID=1883 RepID=UPI00140EBAB5|nr:MULTISPECIES: methylmalonyl-CoA mutase subunit beta [unclassified Streptomyces]QIK05659.1 methylmalonyl-CoA mutase [Streptomyces sp. ID38640]UYB38901.1 methylmalonyl-CoA mutase subunit beta [Streptomyces sp. Je 1-4]UZQ34894.1 methylmalonyl-CoA mutase subunit beta [Streptomyces sp. Je 1-4] [Streptomyces sp. Je 1-4 4N24]UZQ42312.1 methylmalonyl-CoA mutase subunit beta [Streptomyces sp. Je 1-4] [Streptomyces sp. Je 1-4 4N24_ara]